MKKYSLILLLAAACSVPSKNAGTGCPPCPDVCLKKSETVQTAVLPSGSPPELRDTLSGEGLLAAAVINAGYLRGLKADGHSYNFAGREVTPELLAATGEKFLNILESGVSGAELQKKLLENFDFYSMAGRDEKGEVLFSSYYEPTFEASLEKNGDYKYPLYARPPDLITVSLSDFGEKFKGETLSGRVADGRLKPYLNRDQIDFQGALDGKGLELAWVKDRADLMDLHIEGSGRLILPDGRRMKAGFAATNGLKFKGWLSYLAESGALPREGISHEKGKQYLLDHPEKVREIMSANRRYTFFGLRPDNNPETGPTGTFGKPLTPWRSAAVDNSLIPLGLPAFISVEAPDTDEEGNFLGRKKLSAFVFTQDTGGAIKGPGRIDYFAGAGAKAKAFAFKLWTPGTVHLLLLKDKK